jgi:hypothetical protein
LSPYLEHAAYVLVDDIFVVVVHFTKENGELSSVTLDAQSRVELSAS